MKIILSRMRTDQPLSTPFQQIYSQESANLYANDAKQFKGLRPGGAEGLGRRPIELQREGMVMMVVVVIGVMVAAVMVVVVEAVMLVAVKVVMVMAMKVVMVVW